MRATPLSSRASHRRGDKGAVLVVVLLVMMALLGLGLTGLYLTTGTIQMNANINMRNQALQVAEAGIQRAKEVLNRRGIPGWDPNISNLLSGNGSPANQSLSGLNLPDAIPASPDDCLGGSNFQKGAVLRDEPGSVSGCDNPSAYLNCALAAMTDPNEPNNPRSLGNYTVFIRQDQAECRLGGNLNICENGRGSSSDLKCVDGIGNEIISNGIVVVRSEGTASDKRTMVAIEITMARNPNPSTMDTRLATVCPAGQAGCDDNASVQQGITVSGALTPPPPTPPTTGGSTGAGGAGGSSGASGSAGAAGGSTTSPLAGNSQSGGAVGGGGGGGSGGSSASSSACPTGQSMCGSACCGGTCVSGVCCPAASHCNNIAIIGEYGVWGANGQFKEWLATHSSDCSGVDTLALDESNVSSPNNWTKKLSSYGTLIVLDLFHTHAEATVRPTPTEYRTVGSQRQFTNDEVTALRNWVRSGRGLITTIGVADVTDELANANRLLAEFNLRYRPSGKGRFLAGNSAKCWIIGGDPTCPWQWVNWAPLKMANVKNLQVDRGWPLEALGTGPTALAEPVSTTKFYSWGDVGMVVDNASNVANSPAGQGRVVAWADEWLTYDRDWAPDMNNHPECPAEVDTSTPYWKNNLNSCTQRYWNNIIAWVKAGCH